VPDRKTQSLSPLAVATKHTKRLDRRACFSMYASRAEIINLTFRKRLLCPGVYPRHLPAVYRHTNRSRQRFELNDASIDFIKIELSGEPSAPL
jgi:hypothetical protein